MLAAYIASSGLLAQQREALGDSHPVIEGAAKSEVAHLIAIFRRSPPDRVGVTQLMSFVHQDKSRSFSQTQKQSLIEAASVRLSTTVATDGVVALQGDLHAGQKM